MFVIICLDLGSFLLQFLLFLLILRAIVTIPASATSLSSLLSSCFPSFSRLWPPSPSPSPPPAPPRRERRAFSRRPHSSPFRSSPLSQSPLVASPPPQPKVLPTPTPSQAVDGEALLKTVRDGEVSPWWAVEVLLGAVSLPDAMQRSAKALETGHAASLLKARTSSA